MRSVLLNCFGIFGVVAFHAATASAQQAPETGIVNPAPDEQRVVGGAPSKTCGWPMTVGHKSFSSCTGTLIHPRVITLAAHCSPKAGDTFVFGEKSPAAFSVKATKCAAGASGTSGAGTTRDWAYCVIPDDEKVKKMPFTPPIVGCEAERFLKPGAMMTIVGFGITGNNKSDSGTKREVETPLIGFGTGAANGGGKDMLIVGDGKKGGCHGDSGGPVFIHLTADGKDWGWRNAGMTSGPVTSSLDCEGKGQWVPISMAVKEIEKNEGIDVTPCTDANGAWAPGPDCKDFPTDPGNAGGSWPACDIGPKTTLPIDSCAQGPGGTTGGSGGSSSGGQAGSSGSGGKPGSNSGGTSSGGTSSGGSPTAGSNSGGNNTGGSLPPASGGTENTGGRNTGGQNTGGRSTGGQEPTRGGTEGTTGGSPSTGGDSGKGGANGNKGGIAGQTDLPVASACGCHAVGSNHSTLPAMGALLTSLLALASRIQRRRK